MNYTVLEVECVGMDNGGKFPMEDRIWLAPLCGAEAAEREKTYLSFHHIFLRL